MKLGVLVGLGPGHIVLDGDPALPPLKWQSLPFSAHICCGQMAEWIKMPLGREVGLGPSGIVLDGDPVPAPPKREQSPTFSADVYSGQLNGRVDQDATWYEGRLRPRPHCVIHGNPAPPKGGGGTAPNFLPMSIVAKRSPISATAEHLL